MKTNDWKRSKDGNSIWVADAWLHVVLPIDDNVWWGHMVASLEGHWSLVIISNCIHRRLAPNVKQHCRVVFSQNEDCRFWCWRQCDSIFQLLLLLISFLSQATKKIGITFSLFKQRKFSRVQLRMRTEMAAYCVRTEWSNSDWTEKLCSVHSHLQHQVVDPTRYWRTAMFNWQQREHTFNLNNLSLFRRSSKV